MKTFYNDYEHKQLKKRLWTVEAIVFVIALLLSGVSHAQDTTPPQRYTEYPTDNQIGVLVNETISFGLNENIVRGTGTVELHDDSGLVESKDATDPTITIFNGTGNANISLNFSTPLLPETNYHLIISNGAFEDLAGNPYEGISDPGEWNFTTMDNELDPPVLIYTEPAHLEIDIEVDDIFSSGFFFEFDEVVLPGSGNIEIRNSSNDALIYSVSITDEDVGFSGEGIDVYEAVVPYETQMYIIICGTCITDVLGNPFPGTTAGEWSFTTVAAPDITPPIAQSFSPADDATQIAVDNWTFQVTFNEDVQLTGTSNRFVLFRNSAGSLLHFVDGAGGVTVSGATMTINFNHDGSLDATPMDENAEYYIQIQQEFVEDLSGNDFSGFTDNATWNFFTIDTIEPTVTLLTPGDDQTGVLVNTELSIEFNESIQKGSGSIQLHGPLGPIESDNISDLSVEIVNEKLTWAYDTPLQPETTYHIILTSNAIQDVYGNAFAGFATSSDWNFTTMDNETDPPIIISLDPDHLSTDINPGDFFDNGLFIQFDEPITFTGTGVFEIRESGSDELIASIDLATHPNLIVGSDFINPYFISIPYNKEMYVLTCGDCVTDVLGNPFPANNPGDWSFTTEPGPFITTWKTDNPGTSADNQITIPINAFATTGHSIDWGDGEYHQWVNQ